MFSLLQWFWEWGSDLILQRTRTRPSTRWSHSKPEIVRLKCSFTQVAHSWVISQKPVPILWRACFILEPCNVAPLFIPIFLFNTSPNYSSQWRKTDRDCSFLPAAGGEARLIIFHMILLSFGLNPLMCCLKLGISSFVLLCLIRNWVLIVAVCHPQPRQRLALWLPVCTNVDASGTGPVEIEGCGPICVVCLQQVS